jgi:hypothetical protein
MTPWKRTNKLSIEEYQLGTNPDGFNKAKNTISHLGKVARTALFVDISKTARLQPLFESLSTLEPKSTDKKPDGSCECEKNYRMSKNMILIVMRLQYTPGVKRKL